jgi:hypothetical protein
MASPRRLLHFVGCLPFAFGVALGGSRSLEAAAFLTHSPANGHFFLKRSVHAISSVPATGQGVAPHRQWSTLRRYSGAPKHGASELRDQMRPRPSSSWPIMTSAAPRSHLGHRANAVRSFPPCSMAVRSLRGGTDAAAAPSLWTRTLGKGKGGCLWRKQPPSVQGQAGAALGDAGDHAASLSQIQCVTCGHVFVCGVWCVCVCVCLEN